GPDGTFAPGSNTRPHHQPALQLPGREAGQAEMNTRSGSESETCAENCAPRVEIPSRSVPWAPLARGQREGERRSLARLTLHPDPPAMQLNKLPGQGQPEPGPLDLLVRGAHLPKLLEDRLLVLWCDAHASVGDGDLGRAIIHRATHVDPTTLRRELEGIGEQVQEDLLYLPFVAPDYAHPVVDGTPESDPTAARPLSHEDQG